MSDAVNSSTTTSESTADGHSADPVTNTGGDWIDVQGARTHNLRGIDVRIPRGKVVAFTGVSGSGKTSLAIDTLHAEAQLRYLEGLTPFVRQFITPKDRPQVDRITGLNATLAVDQRRLNRSARSTVATLTGSDAYLGLMFSRLPALAPGGTGAHAALSAADFDRYSPEGGCEACRSAGRIARADPDMIVTDPSLPLQRGASPWFARLNSTEHQALPSLAEHYGADLSRPWRELPAVFRHAVLYGTGDTAVEIRMSGRKKDGAAQWNYTGSKRLAGALAEAERLYAAASTDKAKERYAPFMRTVPCERCGGTGYGEKARSVRLGGLTYREVADLRAREAADWAERLPDTLPGAGRALAEVLAPELAGRLRLLVRLGLGHVQLSRSAPSLSGGELQRARVAAQLGTELTGLVFVLDEPGAGLHPADKEDLHTVVRELRDRGNTVLLVEHDPAVVGTADWIVDIGPGAGAQGGRLVAAGPPAQVARHTGSLTARYLDPRGYRLDRVPRPPDQDTRWLTLRQVKAHNVAADAVRLPLHRFTCITGVSGSGKSSLLHDALAACTRTLPDLAAVDTVGSVDGAGALRWSTVVDQDPIGRTPRSNPATYTKAFDHIRALFAATPQARAAGLTAGAFSFNSPGGRCEQCAGHGRQQVDMHFLPDVWVTCDVCDGRRFQPEVLAVRYCGLALDEVLALTVDEAAGVFTQRAALAATFQAMRQVGLGYLQLGQSATELSGGEAQRLKLANAILQGTRGRGAGLVILDEPSTGLHPYNVELLLDTFDALVDAGHTVVVADHDLHVAACADWVLDMGPGAGEDGGRLIGEGTAQDVAAGDGPTARYLRWLLRAPLPSARAAAAAPLM